MYDLVTRPLVFVPVKWKGVTDDANGNAVAVEHVVDIQFDMLDRSEMQAWGLEAGKDDQTPADEIAAFKRIAKGWRVRNNGKPAEFTDENIALLLQKPGFVRACGEAFQNAWQGQVEVREGNSASSPANGPAGGPTDGTNAGVTSKS